MLALEEMMQRKRLRWAIRPRPWQRFVESSQQRNN